MNKKTFNKKSPLKARPLHNPGQSLDKKIQNIFDEEIFVYLILSLITILLAVAEWDKEIRHTLPQPIFWSFIATVVTGFSTIKIVTSLKKIKNYKLGRDGEKIIGQYLETLRREGYHIFHDLIGKNFNVDHIIIGRGGVFTVETKTFNKPEKGTAVIEYDGEKVRINGLVPPRDPIAQAKAQRDWLQKLIKDTCGRKVNVQPVVVYPGWYVHSTCSNPEVWVINPKGLQFFLDSVGVVLSTQNIDDIAFHLSKHLRENNSFK